MSLRSHQSISTLGFGLVRHERMCSNGQTLQSFPWLTQLYPMHYNSVKVIGADTVCSFNVLYKLDTLRYVHLVAELQLFLELNTICEPVQGKYEIRR